ncbi:MAG: ferritin-like domain-containing protein [Sulfuriferula sp.]
MKKADKAVAKQAKQADVLDKAAVIGVLNKILELELAGVVRYTHYSLLIFGYSRIPIVSWLREQADESLIHAQRAGELVTHLGGHPSLAIGPLLETHKHNIADILHESLEHERGALAEYRQLLELTQDRSVMLEEYARELIYQEELHAGEVDKMLRKPGDIAAFSDT